MRRSLLIAATVGLLSMSSLPVGAVVIGQVDNFEDGTTQNWTVGLLGAPNPALPQNVGTGGPAGAGDNYLLLTSIGGFGAGSRMTVINPVQWGGDYLATGVNLISMDVKNLGGTDLYLRLLFEDPTIGPPDNVAFSTDAIVLTAGSDWTRIYFPIGLSTFTASQGSVAKALSGATVMRLYSGKAAGFPGAPVVAQLGVDNITAGVVPEPGTGAFAAAALALGVVLRRARSRSR